MKMTWDFSCGSSHTVSIQHGFWSGKASIELDGREIFQRGIVLFDTGFEHRFRIDDIPCIVRVLNRPFAFTYELWVDGKLQ